MNDATAQQLAQAIQALAMATAAPPAAPAAIRPPAIPDHISPYDGNALDLSSWTGTSLFQKGSEALASKFTGLPVKHLCNLSSIPMPASSSLTLEPPFTCGTNAKTSLHIIASHVKNKNKTKCWESTVKPLNQLE